MMKAEPKTETEEEREERLHHEAWVKRCATKSTMPMQPIELDDAGTPRFKVNALVRWLLDSHPHADMNAIAVLPGITDDERSQFAQLIGYSTGGYGDLSYALGINEADKKAGRLLDPAATDAKEPQL